MSNAVVTAAVILNYNDNENTLRLSKKFAEFDCIGLTVIVDNSGEMGLKAADIENIEKTVLVNCPNNGYSYGNNVGLKTVDKLGGADFIIISNPDVFVEKDAVEACIDFLKNNKDFAAAAPRMHNAKGIPHHLSVWHERTFKTDLPYCSGILSRTLGMCHECYPESYFNKPVAEVDCVTGSFFAIKRDILKKIGDFDTNTFLYYEEDILGFKLKRLGYKTALLCDKKFLHCEGASVNKTLNYLKKYKAMQKSRLYFHKNYLKTSAPKYFVLCLATGLGTVEKFLKTVYYKVNSKIRKN